jgi:hypothetical protein
MKCDQKAYVGWDDGGYTQDCKLELNHDGPCIADIQVSIDSGGPDRKWVTGTLIWSAAKGDLSGRRL